MSQVKTHKCAIEINAAKSTPDTQSIAGKTFFALRQDCRHRIANLMRNTYAVVKHNRPLRDYVWLCDLDKTKGVDIGDTYINEKAALEFMSCIAEKEKNDTKQLLGSCPFFSFMMDGTTDISVVCSPCQTIAKLSLVKKSVILNRGKRSFSVANLHAFRCQFKQHGRHTCGSVAM